jgi:DNA-binding NtrC family response regulator
LHVFPITLPPLRERPEDIPGLVRHFLARFAAEEGKRIRSVAADAIALLQGFAWPGNVRQLENAMFRAVVLADGVELGTQEFPQIVAQATRMSPMIAGADVEAAEPLLLDEPPLVHEADDDALPIAAPPEMPASGGLALIDNQGEVRPLDEIEADAIRFAIAHYHGQMSEVARKLRIGRSTLYRKLESLGLGHADADPGP